MANEMFTKRDGSQVPVPTVTLPSDVVTSLMRMQEDYAIKGKRYGLAAIALDLILTGRKTYERRLETAQKNKDNKNTGKAVKEYIRVQLILRKAIDPNVIAELSGIQMPEPVQELDGFEDLDSTDLTNEQLEQATSTSGLAS